MSTFTLPGTVPSVSVDLPENLSKNQLLSFPAFKTWLASLKASVELQKNESHPFHTSPYKLRSIEVQACDFFGGGRVSLPYTSHLIFRLSQVPPII